MEGIQVIIRSRLGGRQGFRHFGELLEGTENTNVDILHRLILEIQGSRLIVPTNNEHVARNSIRTEREAHTCSSLLMGRIRKKYDGHQRNTGSFHRDLRSGDKQEREESKYEWLEVNLVHLLKWAWRKWKYRSQILSFNFSTIFLYFSRLCCVLTIEKKEITTRKRMERIYDCWTS